MLLTLNLDNDMLVVQQEEHLHYLMELLKDYRIT
jgi:hypothetical protein